MTPNNGNVQPPTRLGQHLTRRSLLLLPMDATLPKHPRKDRGPNWLPQEVTALVNIKRDMYLEEIDIVDARDLMNPDATKWFRVSQEVMKADFSPCVRDAIACKTKWNQIIPDYKRIANFFARTGRNGEDYCRQLQTVKLKDCQDPFHATFLTTYMIGLENVQPCSPLTHETCLLKTTTTTCLRNQGARKTVKRAIANQKARTLWMWPKKLTVRKIPASIRHHLFVPSAAPRPPEQQPFRRLELEVLEGKANFLLESHPTSSVRVTLVTQKQGAALAPRQFRGRAFWGTV